MAAGTPLTLRLDCVRAYDILTTRKAMRPQPCAWRALFTNGHTNCAPPRKCKCNPHQGQAPAYDAAVEGALAQQVKACSAPALHVDFAV